MPTREQLIEGLRKADAAGDTFAANRFAELIKQQPKQQEDMSSQPSEVPVAEDRFKDSKGFDIPEFGTSAGVRRLFKDDDKGLDQFLSRSGQILKDSAAAVFTMNPQARLDGISERFPDLEVIPFGDNNAVIKNPKNGALTVLNEKGVSMEDIAPIVGSMIAFTPAAKAVQIPATVLGKVGAGAVASGATDAALQGVEKLQGSDQEFNKTRTAVTSALGGILPGIPAAARSIAEKPGVKKLLKGATPTIENIKARAGAIYQEIDDLGASLDDKFTSGLFNRLNKKLAKEGVPELLPTKIKQLLGMLQSREGKKLSLGDLDSVRKSVGDLAKSADPAERRLGSIVTEQIDDAFELAGSKISMQGGSAASKFKEARSLWRTAKKAEIVDNAMNKAINQASGFENGIRTQFRSILNNQKLKRNFSKDELAAMNKVVRGGKAENILRALGKFGFTEGHASQMLLGSLGVAGGAAVGGAPGAVAVPLAGQISKTLAQRLTRNNAAMTERLIKVGPDALEIARTYFRATPKTQRSAEELAELFMLRGAKLEALKSLSTKNTKHFRELVENAGLIASGSVAAQ